MSSQTTFETLHPPSARGLNLPNDSTPCTNHGARKHIESSDTYRKWDFLEGNGPSSSKMFNAAQEKKPFRVGWDKNKRHLPEIRSQEPGHGAKEGKECLRPGPQPSMLTSRHITDNVHRNRFNPVTGGTYDDSKGTWVDSTNPWQHYPGGLKPASTISKPSQDALPAAGSVRGVRTNTAAIADVQGMRQARLANDGLSSTVRSGGTAADCLRWG